MDTQTGQVFNASGEELQTIRKVLSPEDPGRFVELPNKPEFNCNKCKGRGTLISWGTKHKWGACPQCFPDHEQKAVSFKQSVGKKKNRRDETRLQN